jgi:hypothetical protein
MPNANKKQKRSSDELVMTSPLRMSLRIAGSCSSPDTTLSSISLTTLDDDTTVSSCESCFSASTYDYESTTTETTTTTSSSSLSSTRTIKHPPPWPMVPFTMISPYFKKPSKEYKKKRCGEFEYHHTLYYKPLPHDHSFRIRWDSLDDDDMNKKYPSIPDITLHDFGVNDPEDPHDAKLVSIKNKPIKKCSEIFLRHLVSRFEGYTHGLDRKELISYLLIIYLDAPDIMIMCREFDEDPARVGQRIYKLRIP